jgi:hypothetical protein
LSSPPISEPKAGSYVPKVIFSYAISHLSQTKKVSFFYALKGRYGKDGVIKKYGVSQLAKSVLVVPAEHSESIENFLRQWGCAYTKQHALVNSG